MQGRSLKVRLNSYPLPTNKPLFSITMAEEHQVLGIFTIDGVPHLLVEESSAYTADFSFQSVQLNVEFDKPDGWMFLGTMAVPANPAAAECNASEMRYVYGLPSQESMGGLAGF